MRLKFGVAVAGSHGKTTTTSMLATLLSAGDLDPTVVVGGRVGTMGGSNARVGHSDFLLVESDESDGSFLKLAPIVAVITNIDREHLDHYGDFGKVVEAFTDFANKVPFYGASVLCLDDEHVQRILPLVSRRTITYGRSAQADLTITGISADRFSSEFRLRFHDEDLGEFQLAVPGEHNVLNATAAIAVCLELEVDLETVRDALTQYAGVDRRFQHRGEASGVAVVDDYGHHPTEIRATLATARQCGYERILVLFQPHRYSRTQLLMEDFARAFHQADAVFVSDIYAASEPEVEGISAQALVGKIQEYGHRGVKYSGSLDDSVRAIVAGATDGDVILTLGAGSVSRCGDRILDGLKSKG
jgi:UDP-N-acetylmuramate--alanine ligase